MDATKEIKRIMLETDTSLTELADRLETSTNNINNKMRRNNWRMSELKEIFGCMGYEVDLKVTKMVDEYETIKQIEQFINLAGKRIEPKTDIQEQILKYYKNTIASKMLLDRYGNYESDFDDEDDY